MGIGDVKGESDGALVVRVLEGDTDAFAGLVARYRDRLGRYAVRMLGNTADAEEALQDAFVRAYRSLARCTDPERFGAWLFGILVNRCRTVGGQRARRQRVVVNDEPALARASVDHTEERDALRAAIEWAVAQLSPMNREAFLLKHVEELSYDEMETITGASVSALKMRVARARAELQQLLTEADRD
ncbi:MAG: RNA polymerase sigma factor [Gemmatimonadales bacterium]|jgi:RNA polymerase sigma-70 factor (ECF subfamily)